MKTYLQLILDCFASMDIEGLRLYLKDEYEYQNTSKDVFLNKIEEIFLKLKRSSDSSLLVFPGSCCHLGCSPELTRSGFRFIGDISRGFFELRFIVKEYEGDTDVDITEIFNCNYFVTNEETENLGERYEVFIFRDEELDFVSSPDHLIYTDQAIRAKEELATLDDHYIAWEYAVNWLFNNKQTYDYIYENNHYVKPLRWTEFDGLYWELSEVVEVFQKLAQFEVSEFLSLKIDRHEKEMISGILKVEEILDSSLLFFHQKIESDENGYYWKFGREFYLRGGLVTEVGKWMHTWFYPSQKLLVEKYFALTEAELDQIVEFDEVPEFERRYHILTTHMNIRKKAIENGNWIPFYLGSKEQTHSRPS